MADEAETCHGCGKEPENPYRIDVTQDEHVVVCGRLRRGSSYWSEDYTTATPKCLRRALQKLHEDPTCWRCGGRAHDKMRGLCNPCAATVQAGFDAGADREMCAINEMALQYTTTDVQALVHALAALAGTETKRTGGAHGAKLIVPQHEGTWNNDWYQRLMLTEGQQEALKTLIEMLDEKLVASRNEGFRSGSSILRRLADGDVSVKDFEEQKKREW